MREDGKNYASSRNILKAMTRFADGLNVCEKNQGWLHFGFQHTKEWNRYQQI